MRILIDEAIWNGRALFSPLGDVRTYPGRALAPADLAGFDALVVRSVTRVDDSLLGGSSVRFVGSATSGADHIDADYLARRGIHLALAEGANARPVAEYVLTVTLRHFAVRGMTPAGRTMGVVGVGHVGSIVRDWAVACGMSVLCCDPPRATVEPKAGPFMPFVELLRASDVVTLHVPLTRAGPWATRDMMDGRRIAELRPGALFINTARGEVVDEDALTRAREARRVAAAVDVWRNEPRVNPHLVKYADLATPHVAGYSVESRRRAALVIRNALASFLDNDSPSIEALQPSDEPRPSGRAAHPLPSVLHPLSRPDAQIREIADRLMDVTGLARADENFRAAIAEGRVESAFDSLRAECAARRELSAD